MPHYLNLSVVFQYDFIITYMAVVFFIHWILAKLRLKRLRHVFGLVWQRRKRKIDHRRSCPVQEPNRE